MHRASKVEAVLVAVATSLTSLSISAVAVDTAGAVTAATVRPGEDRGLTGDVVAKDGAPDPTDLVGTSSRPKRDVEKAKRAQAAQRKAAAASVYVSGFLTSTASVQSVAVGVRAYESPTVTSLAGFGTRDSTGVRMFTFAGQTQQWNHPVGQAQYALANMNSYRVTNNPVYLEIAERNAQRLVDRRTVSDLAWFYPYDFDFAVHGDTSQTLLAPWYSAMAQGQALSVFTRLYQVTGDVRWQTAAEATVRSLMLAPSGSAPFASRVDSAARLWFEEYPRYPPSESEQVLNGHMFALFGLHDYWQLTHDSFALQLYRGGLRTVELTVPQEFRRPSWASVYSLHHGLAALSYHHVHVDQFLHLWRETKRPFFITVATTYRGDYPYKWLSGTAVITPRVGTMWKVTSSGVVAGTRAVSFSRNTGAPWDYRQRINGGPVGLRVSAGAYTGWYVPEQFGVAWSTGAIDVHGYLPPATIQFAPKSLTAYRLDSAGNVAGYKNVTITRASNAPTRYSAFVQGRPAWYFEVGAFAGYWVPMQSGVAPIG